MIQGKSGDDCRYPTSRSRDVLSRPDNLRHVADFIIAYAALLEEFPGFAIDHAESAPTLVTPYGFGLSDFDRDEVLYLAGELKKKGFTD